MRNLYCRLLLYKNVLINRLLTSAFVLRGGFRDFGKEGALYGQHGWPTKNILGFRWSKKSKIALETISFWRNISINIFKFFPFLYTMKAHQSNLILVMNITQTNFIY